MAIYLLDTSVIVDAMNGRRNRRELLASSSPMAILTCCTINVIEVYTGMRPYEEPVNAEFLGNLGNYAVTRSIARSAGMTGRVKVKPFRSPTQL